MSRIIQDRINAGDSIDATDLNNRFTAYSQPGALDVANHGAASIDLPQVRGNQLITIDSQRVVLGTGSYDHSSVESIPSYSTSPAGLVEVGGGSTRLNFGLTGWTVTSGDILRVYWDIGARPYVTGRPYGAPNLGTLAIDDGAGGQFDINDCLACWVLHLEMDTTDATLANFVPVPGQTDFQAGTPAFGNLSDCAAMTVVPAYLEYSAQGNANEGATSARTLLDMRWGGVSGAYWYTPSGSQTIYGLRIVAHGIYHAKRTVTQNRLELFTAVGGLTQYLELTNGQLSAVHMRRG